MEKLCHALIQFLLYTLSMWILFFLYFYTAEASLGDSTCISWDSPLPYSGFFRSLEAKLEEKGFLENPKGKVRREVTVFGEDDRKKVDVSVYPYRTIGRLKHAKGFCSSVLIGPCHAITARHCIHSKDPNVEIQFGEASPVAAEMVLQGKGKSYENDWAVVKLEKPVGMDLGWMPVLSRTPEQLKEGKCRLGGYPSDINEGLDLMVDETATFKGDFSDWKHGDPPKEIKSFGKNMVQLKADAYHGNSGGPIFCVDKEGVARVVAVMSFIMGTPGGNVHLPDDSDLYSGAVATSSFAKQVKKLREKDACVE